MGDKIRGALFNMLGDLNGLHVLDAFAGSGALSFEAVSRGAKQVIAIDSDREAQKAIARNIQQLGLGDRVQLVSATVNGWVRTNPTKFDIVLCDPPFDEPQYEVLERVAVRVKPDGLLVLCWPGAEELPKLKDLTRIEQRTYGDAQLAFYRRIK